MNAELFRNLLIEASTMRSYAQTRGNRTVGAALLSETNKIYRGCNIQQKYHIADVHAEVAAITSMICDKVVRFSAIAIVSDGDGIPPCGACRDWIIQFGTDDPWVIWSGLDTTKRRIARASELMPYPPQF